MNEDLVSVVRETMQPADVSVWLRPDAEAEARSVATIEQLGHDE